MQRALLPAVVLLLAPLMLMAENNPIWQRVAEGGTVVVMRHAATVEVPLAQALALSGDCTSEQQLSRAGEAQARAIGQQFATRGIKLEQILSSEYCRARATAELMGGAYATWSPLNLLEAMTDEDRADSLMEIEELIADYSGSATLLLITHRSTINSLLFRQVEAADMVVVLPDGKGRFNTLGLISTSP
jgi:phosphohistidine phosphatase SixA